MRGVNEAPRCARLKRERPSAARCRQLPRCLAGRARGARRLRASRPPPGARKGGGTARPRGHAPDDEDEPVRQVPAAESSPVVIRKAEARAEGDLARLLAVCVGVATWRRRAEAQTHQRKPFGSAARAGRATRRGRDAPVHSSSSPRQTRCAGAMAAHAPGKGASYAQNRRGAPGSASRAAAPLRAPLLLRVPASGAMRGITAFRGVAGGLGGGAGGAGRRPRRSAQQPCHASSSPQPGGGDKASVRMARCVDATGCRARVALR